MGSNLVLSFILAASLNYLWSMVNGLQLATHMQLFNVKFPANAGFLVSYLVEVSTFDMLPVEAIWYFLELPDRGAYNVNFASSGYEYLHATENLGTSTMLVQVYIISCMMCFVLMLCRKRHAKIEKLYLKFSNFLFWGAALRFIFEGYLGTALCVCIGLTKMEWEEGNFGVEYNNYFTFGLAIALLIMPFYTSLFYGWKINELDDEEFTEKFGTLYSGLNLDTKEDKRKIGLFFPFFFVVRRILFVFAAIFLEKFLWF